MEKESNQLKADTLKMAWYMRGGVSYGDILNMGISERQAIVKIIEENLETTKTSKMPFF